MQVKDVLTTLKKDTFEEVKDLYPEYLTDSEDYDISSLHLACLLNDAIKTASILIGMEVEQQTDTLKNAMLNKLIKTINACTELFDTLFN